METEAVKPEHHLKQLRKPDIVISSAIFNIGTSWKVPLHVSRFKRIFLSCTGLLCILSVKWGVLAPVSLRTHSLKAHLLLSGQLPKASTQCLWALLLELQGFALPGADDHVKTSLVNMKERHSRSPLMLYASFEYDEVIRSLTFYH